MVNIIIDKTLLNKVGGTCSKQLHPKKNHSEIAFPVVSTALPSSYFPAYYTSIRWSLENKSCILNFLVYMVGLLFGTKVTLEIKLEV